MYYFLKLKNFGTIFIKFINDKYASNKFIFKKFKKPISCITQSSSNNNLLITCWDGNVYLLETLNIESYLKFDELSEKNISLNDLNVFHISKKLIL